MAETAPARKYMLRVPVPIVYPIFFDKTLQEARSRGLKINDWGGDLLLKPDNTDIPEIKKLLAAASSDKWPGRPYTEVHFPLKDGDKVAAKANGKKKWAEGMVILKVKSPTMTNDNPPRSKTPPQVFKPGSPVQVVTDPALLPSGTFIGAELSFKANKGNGNNIPDSVTCYVNTIMIIAPGPFIGGRDIMEAYSEIVGKHSAENPLAGGDQIPF